MEFFWFSVWFWSWRSQSGKVGQCETGVAEGGADWGSQWVMPTKVADGGATEVAVRGCDWGSRQEVPTEAAGKLSRTLKKLWELSRTPQNFQGFSRTTPLPDPPIRHFCKSRIKGLSNGAGYSSLGGAEICVIWTDDRRKYEHIKTSMNKRTETSLASVPPLLLE